MAARKKGSENILRYNFILGKAFPSDSIISKWIIGFSIILNDLILANKYLINETLKSGSEPSAEGAYFFRLTCSHFRETIKYIKDIDQYQEIVDFINILDSEILENYNALKNIYIPWENSFIAQKIKPIRDKFFHYPNLKENSALITKLLEELKETMTGINSSGTLKDLRLEFGDEIANAYALDHFIDKDDFSKTMKILVEAVKQMMTFAQGVISKYLDELPDGIVQEEE